MVIQNLKAVLAKSGDFANRDFVRNLLKEELQVFVLNFIYTSAYKNLIFTGGTCLRKFYGLPRISEDLDFDIDGSDFDFDKLQKDLGQYFAKDLQYKNLDLKYKNQTLFLKFPVLKEIGFATESDSDILFLRLDFAFNKDKHFQTQNQLFSAYDFSFLVKTYDLPTLFANKVVAFLTREFKKGDKQTEPFKGRDAFDLVWMLGETKKTGLQLNLERVDGLLDVNNKTRLKKLILEKAEKIKPQDLYNDLKSFFKEEGFVEVFSRDFLNLVKVNIDYL